jgi:hypothetical protein
MMDTQRQFATLFVTDLVNRGILAKEVGGNWTLTQPILGYQADVSFRTKDEVIQKIVEGALAHYSQGLKAAV